MENFDYGIIGGGPAGYTAGMMLAEHGKSVVLFEKDKLGGTCLNRGCIPTKSFLHFSQLYYDYTHSIFNDECNMDLSKIDFSKIIDKKNQTVEKVRKSLELAVKNSGVKTIYEEACVKDNKTIITNSQEYSVNNIIVATGSRPKEIKGLEFDGNFILNSDDILNMEQLPSSVLIVGSGAIGIEWARIFSNFGVEVSIVEMAEHLIPSADIEVSKRIERIFKQRKIKYYLSDCIEKIENKTVLLKSGAVLNPQIVLVAVGRVPVCPQCECKNIIGDACGEIQLAHFAIHQAKSTILGIPFDKNFVPSVIYGEPEIAWAGIREQDMTENCKKHVLPITALGKSWCDDSTDGFIKLITENNKIKGTHIVSKEASALIHIMLIAMQNNMTLEELKSICFAHPTYAEGIFETIMRM